MSKVYQNHSEILFSEGQAITHTILIKEGCLKLVKNVEMMHTNIWPTSRSHEWFKSTQSKAEKRTVFRYKKGQYFGCILEPGNYIGDVITEGEPTIVLMIPNKILI